MLRPPAGKGCRSVDLGKTASCGKEVKWVLAIVPVVVLTAGVVDGGRGNSEIVAISAMLSCQVMLGGLDCLETYNRDLVYLHRLLAW